MSYSSCNWSLVASFGPIYWYIDFYRNLTLAFCTHFNDSFYYCCSRIWRIQWVGCQWSVCWQQKTGLCDVCWAESTEAQDDIICPGGPGWNFVRNWRKNGGKTILYPECVEKKVIDYFVLWNVIWPWIDFKLH